jgi:hypothetical protein
MEAIRQHNNLHTTERLLYDTRCKTAEIRPADVLSLVVDCPNGYSAPHIRPGMLFILVSFYIIFLILHFSYQNFLEC